MTKDSWLNAQEGDYRIYMAD